MANVVYAKSDRWLTPEVFTRRGEAWAADDPAVMGNPDAFTDDPEANGTLRRTAPASPPVVEEATAAPGERRTVRRVRDAPQA